MNIVRLIAAATVAAAFIALLRERGSKISSAVTALVGVLLAVEALTRISPVLSYVSLVSEYVPEECIDVTLKSMGVGVASSVGASACRELGSSELSERLLFCARCEIVVICLPLLLESISETLGSIS